MMKNKLGNRQSYVLQTILPSVLSIGLFVFLLQGCAAPTRQPTPENLVTKVSPLNLNDVRTFIDIGNPKEFQSFFNKSLTSTLDRYSHSDEVLTMLALSGGADGGAFGAGILYGWSESANRPEFDVVTGISTGALMAPFAFLGSESDESLKAVYTGITAENIFNIRSLGEMISARDALASSMPLAQLVAKYIDEKAIEQIGVEHKKGRRLFVGTTHLDSGQLVVWDMGAIAVSGHPEAPQLFRDALIASASIPIAFPPVYMTLKAEGEQYDEIHVDGGLINQVFGIETMARLISERHKSGDAIKARVFMIRNSELKVPWQPVPRKLIDIADRTVSIMINSQSLGDMFRNYFIAQQAGIDFFLTGIPANLNIDHPEPFDTEYMNALFDVGYEMGKRENSWRSEPMGFKPFNPHE